MSAVKRGCILDCTNVSEHLTQLALMFWEWIFPTLACVNKWNADCSSLWRNKCSQIHFVTVQWERRENFLSDVNLENTQWWEPEKLLGLNWKIIHVLPYSQNMNLKIFWLLCIDDRVNDPSKIAQGICGSREAASLTTSLITPIDPSPVFPLISRGYFWQ